MRWLRDFLWGSVPAEFESRFGLQDDSVRKLSTATRRYVFLMVTKTVAVGNVSKDHVSLRRMTPFGGNNVYFFLGEFSEQNGRVVLSGRFTLSRLFKAFMTLVLAFVLFWTGLVTLTLLIQRDPVLWSFVLTGVGALGVLLTLVWLLKRTARNDVVWLSRLIQDSLSH